MRPLDMTPVRSRAAAMLDEATLEEIAVQPMMENMVCGKWERLLEAWCHGWVTFDNRYTPEREEFTSGYYTLTSGVGERLSYFVHFERAGLGIEGAGSAGGGLYAEDAFRHACRVAHQIEQQWIEENVVMGLA